MSKRERTTVDLVEIRRHDGPVMLPTGLGLDAAAAALLKEHAAQEQTIEPSAIVDAFPWETARAMKHVLDDMFGLTQQQTTHHPWFGPQHPAAREIEVGVGETELVPWGAPLEVPGLSGTLNVGVAPNSEGMMASSISAEIQRKDEGVFREIVRRVRLDIEENNIYRGKALRLSFENDQPKLSFLDTSQWDTSRLRFNSDISEIIEDRVLGFVRMPEVYAKAGIRRKRGVLAAGDYGTGKTELARHVISEALHANSGLEDPWTCIWLDDVEHLEQALSYVRRWGRGILFAEDLDQITRGDQRDDTMNALSVALDGLDARGSQVLVYCTTNNYDSIHPVFKRDGRFDVILPMELPNAQAVQELILAYGGTHVAHDADLTEAGRLLAGITPAAIENVVAAAKEAHVARTGSTVFSLTGPDFTRAANAIIKQHQLRQQVDTTPSSKEEHFGREIGRGLQRGMREMLDEIDELARWDNESWKAKDTTAA